MRFKLVGIFLLSFSTLSYAASMNADVVVIGSGLSGMTAAIRVEELGLQAVVIEKQGIPGGASALCGGQYAVQGSQLQKEKGVKYDPPQSLVQDLIANGHLHNNLTTLFLFAKQSPSAADWAIKKYQMKFIDQPLQYRAEFSFDRSMYLKGYCAGLYQDVWRVAKEMGIKVMLNTKADSLISKDGKVTGVIVTQKDGEKLTINAQAVLLATGGYGANKDMLVEPLKSALYYGPASSTGDGHKMAEAVGATLELMQFGKRYPNGVEAAPGRAQTVIQGNYRAWNEAGFLVNKDGNRVVNEKASNNDIMQVLEGQPGQLLYLVMDPKTFEAFKTGVKTQGISEEKLDAWLKLNGKGKPIFAHGKTIEEAAQNAGVNASNLKKSINRYNEMVKKGKDEDFGRPIAFMKKEFSSKGPFYLVEQRPRFATTMGSVVVDDHLRVTDKNNKPIEGLYAAGEIVNAVHGDDSAPGMNVAWGITSGKTVAESIAADLKK